MHILAEAQAEFSLFPALICVLPAAELRLGEAGNAVQTQHAPRPAIASSHPFHSQATPSQRLLPPTALYRSTWGSCVPYECRSASHGGQVRRCQTPAATGELDAVSQPHGLPAASEEAVLRSAASPEAGDAQSSDSSTVSQTAAEAQAQSEEPLDAFELAAAESIAEPPLSALDIVRNMSSGQPQRPAGHRAQPKHGRPSHSSRSTRDSSVPFDDSITSVAGLDQASRRQGPGSELASLEQSVEDPGARSNDGWEDYISIVRSRREAAAAANPEAFGALPFSRPRKPSDSLPRWPGF